MPFTTQTLIDLMVSGRCLEGVRRVSWWPSPPIRDYVIYEWPLRSTIRSDQTANFWHKTEGSWNVQYARERRSQTSSLGTIMVHAVFYWYFRYADQNRQGWIMWQKIMSSNKFTNVWERRRNWHACQNMTIKLCVRSAKSKN